ncbi:hypothetical protein QPK87_32650 [Kamptonema cortianum]|jgi:hypothetical protein|nr:hypothetical protein [Geitlerinema splendidum]MDK3161270.1 hypothetical protein [Kamptonema cortianum]
MQKYILYSILAIFAFSTASFGGDEDEEDRHPNVLIRQEEIPWDLLLKVGRPGGLSPQTHQEPDSKYDRSNPSCTRGKTFYIPEKKFHKLFLKTIPKSH